eukprot:364023-Chlamydomonas_euryale.AAC.14
MSADRLSGSATLTRVWSVASVLGLWRENWMQLDAELDAECPASIGCRVPCLACHVVRVLLQPRVNGHLPCSKEGR